MNERLSQHTIGLDVAYQSESELDASIVCFKGFFW